MEYTKRRNVNRGYMKLEVWNDAMDLFQLVHQAVVSNGKIDVRLASQTLDAAQSISSNIAEGYCRRTLNEYLYFLNVSLGSLGELMTRMIGLKSVERISKDSFESFDQVHYRVENKLLALIKSLQAKRKDGSWEEIFREPLEPYPA